MMMNTLKDLQRSFGAVFQSQTAFPHVSEFGAWREEYRAAKRDCAVFDLTGTGTLELLGKDRIDFVHRLTMNETRRMEPGDVLVNAFTDAKGKLVEAVLQIQRESSIHLITLPNRTPPLAEWIDRYLFVEDVQLKDITNTYALFFISGPAAINMFNMPPELFRLHNIRCGSVPCEIVAVRGLLPPGLLLLSPANRAAEVYRYLVDDLHGKPAGAKAYHALRIENAVPQHGFEISREVNPYEAGLREFISYTKGCYIGQEVIARLDTYDRVKFAFQTLEIASAEAVPVPAPIQAGGAEVGQVTSISPSPRQDGHALALARIRRKALKAVQTFHIAVGSGTVSATPVALEKSAGARD